MNVGTSDGRNFRRTSGLPTCTVSRSVEPSMPGLPAWVGTSDWREFWLTSGLPTSTVTAQAVTGSQHFRQESWLPTGAKGKGQGEVHRFWAVRPFLIIFSIQQESSNLSSKLEPNKDRHQLFLFNFPFRSLSATIMAAASSACACQRVAQSHKEILQSLAVLACIYY